MAGLVKLSHGAGIATHSPTGPGGNPFVVIVEGFIQRVLPLLDADLPFHLFSTRHVAFS
jgi:hypothetical protein